MNKIEELEKRIDGLEKQKEANELTDEEKLDKCRKLIINYLKRNTLNKISYKSLEITVAWSWLAAIFNVEWEADWDNNNQDKWFVEVVNNKLEFNKTNCVNSGQVFFKDKKALEKALNQIGENNLIYMINKK